MGELAQPLLQALGASAGGVPGTPTSPVGIVPPENSGMTEAVMGFPSIMRSGINEAGALPSGLVPGTPSAGGMSPDVDAVVRGFKPKKISFWGALGDQLLKHWGNEPHFEQDIQRKNMRRAMEGFTNDPVEAIRKIAQVPGMEGTAWNLLNQYEDNRRADEAQQRLMGKDRDSVLKNASGLAGIALANPSTRPAAIARYNQILRARGLDDFTLDDDVDDATLAAIAGGAIPPDKREQLELRRLRLEQTGADTQSRIEHRQVQEQQGERRLNQSDRRIEQAAQKGSSLKERLGGRAYKDPNGTLVEFKPDGTGMKATSPDGKTITMFRMGVDGRPVRVRVMSKEEYNAMLQKAK